MSTGIMVNEGTCDAGAAQPGPPGSSRTGRPDADPAPAAKVRRYRRTGVKSAV
jgi:hypothetical protein